MALGLVLDLWTKSHMFHNYFNPEIVNRPQKINWLMEGVLGIQTSTNPGALFGLGKGLSWLFASLSVVALAAIILWLFVWKAARDRWLTIALGLISGGILGNLYDRLGLGYLPEYHESIRTNVRDWVYFRLENVPFFDPWPNFNIADSLLVTGAIMLFLQAVFYTDECQDDEQDDPHEQKLQ